MCCGPHNYSRIIMLHLKITLKLSVKIIFYPIITIHYHLNGVLIIVCGMTPYISLSPLILFYSYYY